MNCPQYNSTHTTILSQSLRIVNSKLKVFEDFLIFPNRVFPYWSCKWISAKLQHQSELSLAELKADQLAVPYTFHIPCVIIVIHNCSLKTIGTSPLVVRVPPRKCLFLCEIRCVRLSNLAHYLISQFSITRTGVICHRFIQLSCMGISYFTTPKSVCQVVSGKFSKNASTV